MLVLAAGGLTAVGAVARAGEAAPRAPAAMRSVRLSGAERRAITIKSLSAVDFAAGLIVTAAFNGDVERYLGQGGLRQALLALVLVPKAAGSPTAGILDEGGGFAPERVRVLTRRGARTAIAMRTVDDYAPERVLGVHTAGSPTVVRAGNESHLRAAAIRAQRTCRDQARGVRQEFGGQRARTEPRCLAGAPGHAPHRHSLADRRSGRRAVARRSPRCVPRWRA